MQVYKYGEQVTVFYPRTDRPRPPNLPADGTTGMVIVAGYDPIVSFAVPTCTVSCDNEWLSLAVLVTGDAQ